MRAEDEGLGDVEVTRVHSRIRIAYTCGCGRRVSTQISHFREGKRCRACAFLKLRGPGNPKFNHDLSTEERLTARKYDEYYAWRSAVFVRDGFKCRRCGDGGRLNAHHIAAFGSAPHLRTDINNGITWCVPCHRVFHLAYGFGGNTEEQLQDFIAKSVVEATWV